MEGRRPGIGWLIVSLIVAGAAAAFAIVAFLSLSSARDARETAQARSIDLAVEVQEAEESRDAADAERAATEQRLADAREDVDEAERAVAEAERREAELEAEQRRAGVDEDGLQTAAIEYPASADAVVDAVAQHLATAAEIADLRTQQAEAVAGGRYRTFNTLQGRYNGLVGDFNEQAGAVAVALEALPSFEYRSVAVTPIAPPAAPLEEQDFELDPPTGPARIEGTFPDSIPCTPRGDGCRWYWEITFTETNTMRVTINRLGIRYTDRRGSIWVSQSGEWRTVDIRIPANGTGSYDNWVQSLDPDSEGNLQGATLQVRWEGTDAEGNDISGRARVTLEWRGDD